MAVDPRVCAKVPTSPKQPEGATLVAPVTPVEARAVELFLGWVAALLDVNGQLEAQAALAQRAVCPKG